MGIFSPLVNYYLKISRRMRWIICSRHGNGCGFGDENALQGTQGGGVKTTGSCVQTNNKQAFLAVRNELVRDGDSIQPTEQEA